CFYRRAGTEDAWTRMALDPALQVAVKDASDHSAEFAATLHDCQEPLEYRVVAGPVESPKYWLRVLHPITITRIEVTIEPPAYTRKPPRTEKSGDLRVIEGSRIKLRATLSGPPSSAEVTMYQNGSKTPKNGTARVEGMTIPVDLGVIDAPVEYTIRAQS